MLMTVLAVAGTAFGSAVLPVVSIELVVIAVSSGMAGPGWLAVAAAAAAGQVAGKSLYLLAARSGVLLPAVLRGRVGAAVATTTVGTRTAGRLQRLRERCADHRGRLLGLLSISAFTGLPPIMLTTVLAGVSGVALRAYVAICLPMRFARFSVIAAAPYLLPGWLR